MPAIQHYPCGLFPHIESGFERKPYFPEAGKPAVFGCRVENPARPAALSYSFDAIAQPRIEGAFAWDNERWTYYSFTVTLPDEPCRMEYSFADGDGGRTETFAVESVSAGDTLSVPNMIDNAHQGSARIKPGARLWRDRHGCAVQAEVQLAVRGEALYGFGEKFDRVNQAGLSALSYVVEQFSDQQEKTYLPIPFFFTDGGTGFFLHGTWKAQFFTEDAGGGFINVRILTECPPSGELPKMELFSGTPPELIRKYTELTGAPALPPRWVFGPWMSSNGWNTQKEATEQIERMNELDIPATAMVLEAWSDEETFYIWNDAQYTPKTDGGSFRYEDFTFPPDGKWPDPKGFAELLRQNDVKLVLWQIPVVKNDTEQNHTQLEADIRYAKERDLCVMGPDGTPYSITEMWFGGSMIPDFTNPETVRWWFDKRRYLIEELGVAGFKTDGGEFLFDRGAVFHDGRTVAEAHNDYPNLYIGAYRSFLDKTAGKGNGVTFSRAGYSGAQRFPVHWAGDQVSTFADLRGQLTAGLSLGLSGVPFWGFDIGGFAGGFPTTELYLRATAFAAFAPIMQFHSEPRCGQYHMTERQHWNNDRSPWNISAANRDSRIIPAYRKFAKLRMRLMPYLWQEARHCAETSRPLMAHLIYDFHTDHKVLNIEDEYMLGRDLLAAPIVTEGAAGRTVYLPAGEWFDFWTGEPAQGGADQYVECGIDSIPVFTKSLSLTWNGGDI